MQVLLSSIGSRGDVQPIVALGLELQALGHRARLCVAPNFKEWIRVLTGWNVRRSDRTSRR